jgi:two-component system, LytTR family, sensor kinase
MPEACQRKVVYCNSWKLIEMTKFLKTPLPLDSRLLKSLWHIALWVLMYLFFIGLKRPLMGLSFGEAAIVATKDVIVIGLIFYFILKVVIPKILFKKRFVLLALSVVAIYYFYALCLYLEFTFLPLLIMIPGRGYQMYAARVLHEGIIGLFMLHSLSEILLDLLYLISPALILTLFISVFTLSTQTLKLQMDNLNLELAFLKAQINPHFLFNTLNNVYSLALHKSDKTADAVLKLSGLMRYTLYESNTAKIPLEKEITFCKDYIELERMRHSTRVRIELNVPAELDHYSIAPLIIFPFIENAFKHGIRNSTKKSWVFIDIQILNNELTAIIRNSVTGTYENEKNIGGIGISNTKKRLNLLYPDKHTLRIEQTDSVFSVILAIRLN